MYTSLHYSQVRTRPYEGVVVGTTGPVVNSGHAALAALSDSANGDRVFFRAADGAIEEVLFTSGDETASEGQRFGRAADGTHLAAVRADDGAVLVLFEDEGDASGIAVARIAGEGQDVDMEVLR